MINDTIGIVSHHPTPAHLRRRLAAAARKGPVLAEKSQKVSARIGSRQSADDETNSYKPFEDRVASMTRWEVRTLSRRGNKRGADASLPCRRCRCREGKQVLVETVSSLSAGRRRYPPPSRRGHRSATRLADADRRRHIAQPRERGSPRSKIPDRSCTATQASTGSPGRPCVALRHRPNQRPSRCPRAGSGNVGRQPRVRARFKSR